MSIFFRYFLRKTILKIYPSKGIVFYIQKPCSIAFFSVLVVLFNNCANPVPPTGGIRDTTPPQLIVEESTPNLQTNFTKQAIELTFDEWVVIKDKIKNILVSPPLEKGNLNVELKRRKVIIEFPEDEILKTDATYVINFGEAIQDLTEGNKVEDLRFVFSTGDKIDSLQLTGNIVNAFDASPIEGTTVMLYRNLADSVVTTLRPFYFSKTDKQGNFTIGNIKAGTYKIAATQDDVNADYQFTVGEQIGFLNENIEVTDSTSKNVTIRLFQEVPALKRITTLDRSYGKVGLQFNQPPYNVDLAFSINNLNYFTAVEKDTLNIWYDLNDSLKWNIYISKEQLAIDTTTVKAYAKSAFTNTSTLQTTTRLGEMPKSLNPTKPILLGFNHPILSIDTSLVNLYEDSIRTEVFANYSLDTTLAQRELNIDYKWKEGALYEVEILPDALTDLYGLKNDTIRQAYQTLTSADFGIIDFTINNLDSTQQYVLRLFFKKTNLIETYIINDANEWKKSVSSLPAGEYNIELIIDENRNGQWDVGNYQEKRQPEIIKFKTLEALRANWNLDVTFTPAEL